ncbi:hypothetical protein [Shivajiella indica]|uniref:Bacterial Pleckstrin homology domain-containing protein n=1 Tax=Shivajiella indica TaxID=872115 RepID=A0ABW5BC35_9BACT
MVVNERQTLRGSMIMWGIIMLELPTLILLTVLYLTGKLGEDGWIVLLVVTGIMVFSFTLIMNMQLILRIDRYGISYQSPPFINNWKKIPVEEICHAEIKKSNGLLDYGGIGFRLSKKTKAFLFYTDHIFLAESANKKYVFSIRNPQEIEEIIEYWKSESRE